MTTLLPLESNPDVLTKYIHKLGVSKNWSLIDVVGLEPEMLEWIPKPVKSIILLFPCSDAYEKHRSEEDEKLAANPPKTPNDLFYMKQLTPNACGTVALIHSIANNKDITLEDGVLKKFVDKALPLNPDERGKALLEDTTFQECHQNLAQEGQTEADPQEKVNHHFVAFIEKDGELYELDGRKNFPVKHGSTSEGKFVEDAAKVCKEFMARDPEELRFTVIALTQTPN